LAPAAEYVDDLRRAIGHPAARVFTYRFRGESYAGFLAPNDFTPPAEGREPYVFVAYSATYGVLRTGYQASSLDDALRGDDFENLTEHSP
jgi:hypothetical protein